MSLTKYEILLKAAECGSFTKAAQELNFTQSGISHAVSSLETELGTKLVVRSHGGVSLTADGRALLPYFQQMCALQHQLEQKAADLRGLDTGLVRVATFTSVSEKWMPYILKSFQELYPRIEFELLPSNFNNEIENWVTHGQADCGFISLPTEPHLDYWLLQRDQWKVIVPCDHPYADRDPFPVSALAEEPFIQLEEGDDYEIMAAFDEMGIRPNVKYIAREDRTILAMVSEGLGISLLPELMPQPHAHQGLPCAPAFLPYHRHRCQGQEGTFQLHPSVRGLCADVGGGKREYINVQLSLKKHENTSCNTDKNAVPIQLGRNTQNIPRKCIAPRNKIPLAKRRGVHHNSTRSPRKVNRLTGLKRCGVSVKVGMWVKVPANRSL